MNQLKDLFGEVAEQAKTYQVGDRAWAAARRRRYVLHTAPVAVAAVLTVSVAATGLPQLRGGDPTPLASPSGVRTVPAIDQVPADDQVESGNLPWLPGEINYPERLPPTLPRGEAVGPGAVVLEGTQALFPGPRVDEKVLVTSSGASYRIPLAGEAPPALSSGGRWLAYQRELGSLVLRDLTGTTEHTVRGEGQHVEAWSPDDRYAVLEDAQGGEHWVDLRTGQQRLLRGYLGADWAVVGVKASGEVVFVRHNADVRRPSPTKLPVEEPEWFSSRVSWSAVDPTTGRKRSGEIRGGVAEDEHLVQHLSALSPDGRTLVVRISGHDSGSANAPSHPPRRLHSVLATMDLVTGRPVARYDLSTGGPFGLADYRSEGIVLYRFTKEATEVQVLDPATGQRTIVSRIPNVGSWVWVRGG